MKTFSHVLHRTCVAIALRTRNVRILQPALSRSFTSSVSTASFSSQRCGTRLFSTFQPADPPGTHGTPVFADIDFSVASQPSAESKRRNHDPHAVFVVTGASRGIGLQFVKTLILRTRVRHLLYLWNGLVLAFFPCLAHNLSLVMLRPGKHCGVLPISGKS
jgi:hypothetical protein